MVGMHSDTELYTFPPQMLFCPDLLFQRFLSRPGRMVGMSILACLSLGTGPLSFRVFWFRRISEIDDK